ncbi:putative polyol transporter 3 [Bienertia sinuspersici]
MSGALIFIKEDLKINDTQIAVLAGILNICALVGALTAGRTSDYMGRRLGVGFALMIAPIYTAEISSPTNRGKLSSLPELEVNAWLAAVPSLSLIFGILKMPESPRWLVLKGRSEDARRVLYCSLDLIAAIGIHFFEHATGIEAVILYSARIFKAVGITSKHKLLLANVGLGISVAVNRSMNAAVSMSFISIYKEITIGGTFLLFGGLTVMAWLFFYFFLPETKGRSLEEIELMFSKKTQAGNKK